MARKLRRTERRCVVMSRTATRSRQTSGKARAMNSPFVLSRYRWLEISDNSSPLYTVHHHQAVLGYDRGAGTFDMILRFEGDGGHCHRHRHVSKTSILVLEGEQHLTDLLSGGETRQKVRFAGEHHMTAGDVHPHMERWFLRHPHGLAAIRKLLGALALRRRRQKPLLLHLRNLHDRNFRVLLQLQRRQRGQPQRRGIHRTPERRGPRLRNGRTGFCRLRDAILHHGSRDRLGRRGDQPLGESRARRRPARRRSTRASRTPSMRASPRATATPSTTCSLQGRASGWNTSP